MSDFNEGRFSQQVSFVRQQFLQSPGLPFSNVLSAELVERVLAECACTWNECVYTPLVTLWVFLSQVLSPDHSCRDAVARLRAHRRRQDWHCCSSGTSAYCQARQRLPEPVLASLVRRTGRELDAQADPSWLWKGRVVKLVDGSTVSMPDTPANQAAYPQHGQQKKGVGFPLARILAVFSLTCGTVLDLAISRFQGKGQSELGMLRRLWHLFSPGDVVAVDRFFCTYFELASFLEQGTDVVARLHSRRRADFRRGRSLGHNDHLVWWCKPVHCPPGLAPESYRRLPDQLLLRELRVAVKQRGFRTRSVTLVTTLLDAQQYPAEDIALLYRARWYAELNLRCLKTTMQMDVLRCKTPEMVHKEIWTHLLAYNLIRTVMAQAALRHGVLPYALSFKATLQLLNAYQPHLTTTTSAALLETCHDLLDALAEHPVADRPNRYEPRVRKRRPKPYPLLTEPRHSARKRMAA